jgi:hypothetical protein
VAHTDAQASVKSVMLEEYGLKEARALAAGRSTGRTVMPPNMQQTREEDVDAIRTSNQPDA